MVGMIREMFDLFNVIVPHKAHGPGTMIALGADTIIMGERGTLSPIEVLISGDSFWKGHSIESPRPERRRCESRDVPFGELRQNAGKAKDRRFSSHHGQTFIHFFLGTCISAC
jgi:hypothetical protein